MAYNIIVTASPQSKILDSMREASCGYGRGYTTIDLLTINLGETIDAQRTHSDLEIRLEAYEYLTVFVHNANRVDALALRRARNWVANYCTQNPDADVKFVWAIDPSVSDGEVLSSTNAIYVELSGLLSE